MIRDGFESISIIREVSGSRLYASTQKSRDGSVVDVDPDKYDDIDIAAGAALFLVSRKEVVSLRMSERVS